MDPTYFRLDPLQTEYNICEDSDIDKNFRLKLLKLRDLGEPEFRGIKSVPLNEKQIHRDIFKVGVLMFLSIVLELENLPDIVFFHVNAATPL